jgi:hypothetical protein
VDSDDEEIRSQPIHSSPLRHDTPVSPASEPRSSPPVSTEVLFPDDIQVEIHDDTRDTWPDYDGDDISPTMEVCTAELLTTPASAVVDAKKVVVEIVEVIETVMEKIRDDEDTENDDNIRNESERPSLAEPEDGEEDDEEDVRSQAEDMEEVEQPATGSIERNEPESSVVEEIVEESVEIKETIELESPRQTGTVPNTAIQPNLTQSQSISTTQGESSITQYPQSTPSIPAPEITTTEDDSQQPTQTQIPSSEEQTQTIPSTLPQPPPYLPPRQQSPPKATPIFQISPPNATPLPAIPASAQIQVQETPLAAQRPAQRQSTFFTSTHISATAPANLSPEKRPVEGITRKHKRDRHSGPLIPKFRRRERSKKYDLTAILLKDRKRFRAAQKEVVQGSSQIQPAKEEPAIEERKVEDSKGKVDDEDEPMEEVIEESLEVEKAPERSRPSFVQSQPSQQILSQSRPISQQFPDTQDDSQMFDPSKSRWGRFAAHWRRFSQPSSST